MKKNLGGFNNNKGFGGGGFGGGGKGFGGGFGGGKGTYIFFFCVNPSTDNND